MAFQPRFPVAAVALASVLSISGAALAQDAGASPSNAQWVARMQAHREARIHALHAILNIRPDQEAAFQTFVTSLHPDKDGRWDHRDGAGAQQEALTTPQRLDQMAQRLAERQAAFRRRADAVRTFYAALSPDQQRAFDAMLDVTGPHDGMRGHDGFGGPQRG